MRPTQRSHNGRQVAARPAARTHKTSDHSFARPSSPAKRQGGEVTPCASGAEVTALRCEASGINDRLDRWRRTGCSRRDAASGTLSADSHSIAAEEGSGSYAGPHGAQGTARGLYHRCGWESRASLGQCPPNVNL
ncbi:hypothetical protein HaLaN_25471 [Haematococcus lacustris]|uniref:Uncharacterized protein n=1 Tax=Haematococcus lacustris TaxID=44745 RepID=A0A699ZXL5_HAELA|nr:hypothetical protein HaLaN_25471 [Haematococcus lacustris]